jgi:hypothetical protein
VKEQLDHLEECLLIMRIRGSCPHHVWLACAQGVGRLGSLALNREFFFTAIK